MKPFEKAGKCQMLVAAAVEMLSMLVNGELAVKVGLYNKVSNEKRAPGCLGFIGDDTTQLYGIIINHYKDPY